MTLQDVSRCCMLGGVTRCRCLCSSGINEIRVKFERNFYLSDEEVKARCYIDNRKCSAKCEKVQVKLIRTIKAFGTDPNMPAGPA